MEAQATETKIRVLIAKVGLDGHEVGAKVVARGLADSGMEVIYTGLRQSPQMVVDTAIQEDVDVIGVGPFRRAHDIFSGNSPFAQGKTSGGHSFNRGRMIPVEDIHVLKQMGVVDLFPSGSSMKEIIGRVRQIADQKNKHS